MVHFWKISDLNKKTISWVWMDLKFAKISFWIQSFWTNWIVINTWIWILYWPLLEWLNKWILDFSVIIAWLVNFDLLVTIVKQVNLDLSENIASLVNLDFLVMIFKQVNSDTLVMIFEQVNLDFFSDDLQTNEFWFVSDHR